MSGDTFTLGWGICGSFCTISRASDAMENLLGGSERTYRAIPVASFAVQTTDTRFGRAADLIGRAERICGESGVLTIAGAEPFGPKIKLDAFIIAPCTGNTLAKIASGVTDTPVTMAVKAHLRNDRPVVIALATNDALSGNLANIAVLLNRKNVYFVPFGQDDPHGKPHSLVCDFALLPETLSAALGGTQLQPLLLPSK